MIAEPDTLDRPVEGQLRSPDLCVRFGMGVPAPDENIVEAAAMMRLPHDLLSSGARVRVVDRPSVTRPFAGTAHAS